MVCPREAGVTRSPCSMATSMTRCPASSCPRPPRAPQTRARSRPGPSPPELQVARSLPRPPCVLCSVCLSVRSPPGQSALCPLCLCPVYRLLRYGPCSTPPAPTPAARTLMSLNVALSRLHTSLWVTVDRELEMDRCSCVSS